jgi:hypothetical protein
MRASSFLAVILIAFLLLLADGCAPQRGQNAATSDRPEITDETMIDRINGSVVRKIPEADGAGEPISWVFYGNEPKELKVVEKQVEGDHAIIVLDVKTTSAERSNNKRYLAGQIRTEWRLESGWALRRWEIVDVENISLKYKNLPKPAGSPTPAHSDDDSDE